MLICDDSPLMRKVLTDLLTDGSLDVVGEAKDSAELLAAVAAHRPDVVTLDVEMPRKNGLQALEELMDKHPMPVIMCSTLTGQGARESVKALSLGAVDVVQKPALRLTPSAWGSTRDELVAKVRGAAPGTRARAIGHPDPGSHDGAAWGRGHILDTPARPAAPGAMAARPGAVAAPPGRPAGVGAPPSHRHPPPAGPGPCTRWCRVCPSPAGRGRAHRAAHARGLHQGAVRAARPRVGPHGARGHHRGHHRPAGGPVAPAGAHLEVSAIGQTRLSDAPAVGNLKPRADITISSAARVYGNRVLLVVLTGMGNDGELGARDLRKAGGRILTEDERTCVIYGMPRAIDVAGLSNRSVPLDAMPAGHRQEPSRPGAGAASPSGWSVVPRGLTPAAGSDISGMSTQRSSARADEAALKPDYVGSATASGPHRDRPMAVPPARMERRLRSTPSATGATTWTRT
ncbi:MAG: chemotaxis protein CheB [Thermoleophilia bacterium]